MLFKSLKSLTIAFALCFSANSFAGIIVDEVKQNVWLKTTALDAFFKQFDSHSYQHNINDDGFVWGSAISATLEIDIIDDEDLWSETILFTVEDFDGDTGDIAWLGGSFDSNLEVNALAKLNADGLLDVTVTSLLGDFTLGDSTLTVVTAEVPEPATLSLLGLGLLGLAYTRRRTNS